MRELSLPQVSSISGASRLHIGGSVVGAVTAAAGHYCGGLLLETPNSVGVARTLLTGWGVPLLATHLSAVISKRATMVDHWMTAATAGLAIGMAESVHDALLVSTSQTSSSPEKSADS